MKHFLRSVHLWLTIPFCLLISLICFTGAALVFEEEITALVAPTATARLPFFAAMSHLHKSLMQPCPEAADAIWWGKIIVGITIIALIALLLTGIYLWWPTKRVRIAASSSRRFLFDLHNSLGILATIFLLIMGLTGLTWTFEWFQLPFSRPTIASLHFGTYWGLTSRILHFLAALIGASLPITGLLIYLRRLRKK